MLTAHRSAEDVADISRHLSGSVPAERVVPQSDLGAVDPEPARDMAGTTSLGWIDLVRSELARNVGKPHFENYTEKSDRCTGAPERAGSCPCGGAFRCEGEYHVGNSYWTLRCLACGERYEYSTYDGGFLTQLKGDNDGR
jgi:hypothetical protein